MVSPCWLRSIPSPQTPPRVGRITIPTDLIRKDGLNASSLSLLAWAFDLGKKRRAIPDQRPCARGCTHSRLGGEDIRAAISWPILAGNGWARTRPTPMSPCQLAMRTCRAWSGRLNRIWPIGRTPVFSHHHATPKPHHRLASAPALDYRAGFEFAWALGPRVERRPPGRRLRI